MPKFLKLTEVFFKAFSENELKPSELSQFEKFVSRRKKSEPIPYILGYKEFYGRKFLVNKNVLIPRPETENLVSQVLNFARNKKLVVVDIGTGSGCIGITLALENPKLDVTISDIDDKALEVARKNAKLFGVDKKIKIIRSNLLEKIKPGVDIVVANLPYIPQENWEKLPKEIKEFEPRIALDSGESKTKLYDKLFSQKEGKLNKNGKIFFEIDGDVFENN